MKRSVLCLVSLALLSGGQANAEFIITFSQSGPNVVANGTGSLNITGLFPVGPVSNPTGVDGTPAYVDLGPYTSNFNADGYIINPLHGPDSIGSSSLPFFLATSSSGQPVGISTNLIGSGTLITPLGYISGSLFTSSATWDNTTISGLGLTPRGTAFQPAQFFPAD
jgi:hypothetical protein